MVNGLWSMGYGLWIYGAWFMVEGLWFMVYDSWFMVQSLWRMAYGLWSDRLRNFGSGMQIVLFAKLEVGSNRSFSRSLICTTVRRNAASACTHRGSKKGDLMVE